MQVERGAGVCARGGACEGPTRLGWDTHHIIGTNPVRIECGEQDANHEDVHILVLVERAVLRLK